MSHRTFLAAALAAVVLGLGAPPVRAESPNDQLIQDAKNGSVAGVQQDLANGADANAKHKNGRTALMLAAEWNSQEDIASVLLAHGTDVNAKDNNGVTALMYAASPAKPDIVRLLLAHGADVNAKDNDGGTALLYAESDPVPDDETDAVIGLLRAAGAH